MRNNIHDRISGVSLPRLTLALVIAMASEGCVSSADADGARDTESTAAVSAALTVFPSTCADIAAAANPGPLADGEYLLFVGGNSSLPWVAFCLGMSGSSPTEYLTLHRTGGSSNFSQYTAGGASPGTSVQMSYTKIRINPATLAINSSDQTFASASPGGLVHHSGTTDVTSMPYAVAMSCDGTPSGLGNIDLQGTPFAVRANAFTQAGAGPVGAAVYSVNNQVVNLTGGGFCGYTEPSPGVFNPFNTHGSTALTLVHL